MAMDHHFFLLTTVVSVLLRVPCSAFRTEEQVIDGDPAISFELSCEGFKGDAVAWTFRNLDGKEISIAKDSKGYQIFTENGTLRVIKPERSFVGEYNCSRGNVTEITFSLLVKPYVTPFEKPRNVIQDDPMKIECKTWGIPDPTITWHFNGSQVVAEGSGGNIVLSNSSSSIENGTLGFKKMLDNAGGNYTCVARSQIKEQWYESNATLLVTVKDKYAALWPFLGICAEVAVLCTIILIYEKRRAKRIEEEERAEEAAHLNANNDTKAPLSDDVRQRK